MLQQGISFKISYLAYTGFKSQIVFKGGEIFIISTLIFMFILPLLSQT